MNRALTGAAEFEAPARTSAASFQSYGVREKFFALCLLIYAATGSIYVFPSGLPQPADFVLALGTLVMLTSLRIPRAFSEIVTLNVLLAIYCFAISAVWVIVISDPDMMRPPMYYIYNVSVFISIILLFWRSEETFYKVMKLALLLAVGSFLLQYVLFYQPDRLRQTLGFNNPNQPAYFALCLICIALILLYRQKLSVSLFYAIGVVLSYILMLGLSMTAATALILAIGISVVLSFRASSKAVIVAILFLPALALIAANYVGANQRFVEAVQTRLTLDRAESKLDDVAERRGYARIIELPHLAIFGAGEAARHRFDVRHRQEIHSSIGTILFSYGLFGLFVYLYWYAYALFRGGIICFSILLVPFIYSLTHQGLRTTMFWILLAMVMIVAFENSRKASKKRTK